MITIQARDFIELGFSDVEAAELYPHINEAIENGDDVTVDFTSVAFFSTRFFSVALTRFIRELGSVEEYDRRIHVTGLSEVEQSAYERSYEWAAELFRMTPEEKEAHGQIVSEVMDDV